MVETGQASGVPQVDAGDWRLKILDTSRGEATEAGVRVTVMCGCERASLFRKLGSARQLGLVGESRPVGSWFVRGRSFSHHLAVWEARSNQILS